MKELGTSLLGLLAMSVALAQPGPPGAPDGRSPGPVTGPRVTPGWSMMSAEERREHHEKLAAMRSYDECRSYLDEHHARMAERARARGAAMPAQPRRDGCHWLTPKKP